ncbi:MAG: hypothetical protein VZR23_09285 [Lachnospiraceae bacterium]|nr:hypothetical protein [Lachnospiraceae bacterium]
MNKVVIIFIEGDTEVDFYKKLVGYYREKNGGRLSCRVEVKNVKGVGNYQNKVLRIFENRIIPQYPGYEYHVVLCYDSDVFEFSRKPPVDWNSVVRALKSAGVKKVEQVRAVRSIEDWFLCDLEGLRSFLHLPKKFSMTGYTGQKGLEQLFRKANRTYIKGTECRGLVDALDISVIVGKIRSEITKIEQELIDN